MYREEGRSPIRMVSEIRDFGLETGVCTIIKNNYIQQTMLTEILRETINQTASKLSDHIVEKYGVEIISKISMEALANMTVAATGTKINETLNKKLPDSVLVVNDTRAPSLSANLNFLSLD